MIRSLRRVYGAGPLHLLALVASLAFAGYVASAWLALGAGAVVRWFVAGLIGHDLILVPLYAALDRIAFGTGTGTARERPRRLPVSAVPYVRVPVLLSGLLGLVFAPEILAIGGAYQAFTGLGTSIYLGRWLAATAAMFALSGLAYAVALGRARRAAGDSSPASSSGAGDANS
jgi:hypothetical protein